MMKINVKIEKGISLTPKEAEYFNIAVEDTLDKNIEEETDIDKEAAEEDLTEEDKENLTE